jgi:hypothetical protein
MIHGDQEEVLKPKTRLTIPQCSYTLWNGPFPHPGKQLIWQDTDKKTLRFCVVRVD